MTSNRVLSTLTLIAAALLLAALGLSSAGLRLPSLAWSGSDFASVDLPSVDRLAGTGAAGDLPVAHQFAVGFLAGWTLRWLYSLPWAALPRAVVIWLMGWRRSVTMLSVAIGCTAVLLLY